MFVSETEKKKQLGRPKYRYELLADCGDESSTLQLGGQWELLECVGECSGVQSGLPASS
jgi:hypothetical protein